MTISAVIRTLNAGEIFDEVLKSLQGIADEIIVIDSGSEDRTIEIAEKYGAKVVYQKWLGFIGQANEGFKHATKDWIFLLDEDEIVSDELRDKIKNELKNPRFGSYEINRQIIYFGKPLKFVWQPEYILRLARRDKNARCIGDEPHETMTADAERGKLSRQARLIHYSFKNWRDQLKKSIDYAEIGANSYFARGKKCGIMKLVFNPLAAFFKIYFLKLGFLDGRRGLIAAGSSAIYTFIKYAFLFERETEQKENSENGNN